MNVEQHEARLMALEQQGDDAKVMLDKMDTKLDVVLAQVNRIAVLEEKHSNNSEAVARAHKRVDDTIEEMRVGFKEMSNKQSAFESEVRAFINHTKGMASMAWLLWGSVGAGVALLGIKVVFFGSVH